MTDSSKLIVGIGGTLRQSSSTELTLRRILDYTAEGGAEVEMFCGHDIDLPSYAPGSSELPEAAQHLIASLRRAHGIVIGSPGYHGSISGLVKNALDYTEEMSRDPRPYFSGRAVACVATGAGWQGANSTLHALRSIVHALRGWPTPLGIALNSREPLFDDEKKPLHPEVDGQLKIVADQLLEFVGLR